MSLPVALYRCFAADDHLLYVGVTADPKQRLALHRSNRRSPWLDRVERVEHEWYEDRVDALLAERIATLTENPEFPSTVTGPSAVASAMHGFAQDSRKAATWKRLRNDIYVALCRKFIDCGYADANSRTPPTTEPFDDAELDRRMAVELNAAVQRLPLIHL